MPRVAIKKKDYMVKDLSEWIVGRMHTMHLKQADVGEMIGISQPAFKNRLDKGLFSYGEMLTLLSKLKATDEEILRLMKL